MREIVLWRSPMQEKSSLEFAARLKRAMADCGLKASGLAEKSVVSKGYVSELLKGHKAAPSFDTVKKFADVLGISPSWLLFGDSGDLSAVVREEAATYRAPLKPRSELSIEERMARAENLLAAMAEKFDELAAAIRREL